MKKLGKIVLVLGMIMGLIGCQSKTKDAAEVGKKFEAKGYKITRNELMKDDKERTISLLGEDHSMVAGVFKKDKSINYFYYSKGKDVYIIKGDEEAQKITTKDMKSEYEEWLKQMDITTEDLENYLTDLNKQVREPSEIQGILDECDFTGTLDKDTTGKYDYNFYMESEKGFYMNGYFKDDKLTKLIFASSFFSTADKLFVYEDGKVTKDDGWVSYFGFLDKYNITSEEFINYFTALYEQNVKK